MSNKICRVIVQAVGDTATLVREDGDEFPAIRHIRVDPAAPEDGYWLWDGPEDGGMIPDAPG